MADHRAQDAKGRVKEAFGSLTNRADLTRKGRADQSKAGAKKTAGDTKNKVKDAVATTKDKLTGAARRAGRR
jgi:uncharacterized protein YjbJ (UPF0337 family)